MSAQPTPPAAASASVATALPTSVLTVAAGAASPLQVLRDDVLATPAYVVPDATGLVKLDAMENPYPLPASLPEPLQAAFAAHLAGVALNRYPVPRYAGLKARLAARARVPDGFELMVGNGSDEIIAILSTGVARPGATILAPMPGFVMYEVSARLAGARFVGVPLRADFALDVDAMRAAIAEHRPALTWLAYPNNPTGNAFDPAAIEAVLRAAQDAGAGFVVADEAYRPFADDSWMPRLAEFPNLLVMQTVSKLGLAGLRLGLLAGRPDAIAEFDKVRPPYNVNVLTEAAADWLLEHGAGLLDAQAATIRADRARLAAELAAVPGVRTVFPSQANFLLFRVDDPAATMAGLRARGVLIKDVSRAHPLLAGCLRVTVGAPDEGRAFVDALRATLAG